MGLHSRFEDSGLCVLDLGGARWSSEFGWTGENARHGIMDPVCAAQACVWHAHPYSGAQPLNSPVLSRHGLLLMVWIFFTHHTSARRLAEPLSFTFAFLVGFEPSVLTLPQ